MQWIAAASQPGSNKPRRRVGCSALIAQVDVLRVVFNHSVWPPQPRHRRASPPRPLVVMLKVNKSLSGSDDSIH